MTFLKRRWPDLVISALIVALLGGFALVMLGGADRGSVFPQATSHESAAPSAAAPPAEAGPSRANSAAQPPHTPPSEAREAAIPKAPDSVGETLPTIPSQAAQPTEPAPSPAESAAPPKATPKPAATAAQTGADQPVATPGLSEQPRQDAASAAASAENASPAAPAAEAAPAREGGPVPTSRAGTPTRAEYRLSAGVFDSEAVARERTASIAALGYTVHLIPVKAGIVAQVGPFADRETAARAADDIRRTFDGITLYSPVGGSQSDEATPSAPGAASASAEAKGAQGSSASEDQGAPQVERAQGTAASSPPQPARVPQGAASGKADPGQLAPPPAPTSASREAPGAPLYLQVGAFDRQDSAAQLVERLAGAGFDAQVNAPPGRKVRVLVGPLSGEALLRAEDKLSALGVAHFRVR